MKRLIAALALAFAAGSAFGAGAALHLDKWPDRSKDVAALQNGARLFANYCLGCHSANLMRWNRLNDIELDDRQIKDFLIFGPQKVGDTMAIAMDPKDAKVWFGKTPPDLSVIARARTSFDYTGADYLYTATTAIPHRRPAGTTSCIRTSACRTCCGKGRGRAK
jgi:ubiquinol-cytochrome c reductase cytochrome c1 subunit